MLLDIDDLDKDSFLGEIDGLVHADTDADASSSSRPYETCIRCIIQMFYRIVPLATSRSRSEVMHGAWFHLAPGTWHLATLLANKQYYLY